MGVQLKGGKSPPRNSPCPCGSGLKFKWCHGDLGKQAICNRLVNEKMVQLIREEQKRRGLVPRNYRCQNCGHTFDEPGTSTFVPNREICPKCKVVDIEKIAEEL